MGTNHIKHNIVKARKGRFINDESGDAVVEATILFPIMTMIFAALVLIAVYLPSQAVLQHSTQYAATALAAEMSDTWLFFSEDSMSYYRETNKDKLNNVYAALLTSVGGIDTDKGEAITSYIESRSLSSKAGELTVSCHVASRLIYNEIIVEASREYPILVNLSLIGFPRTITVSASSTAVVQNGDEFVRNMDMTTDFANYIFEKFGLKDNAMIEAIGEYGNKVKSLLGW